MKKILIFLIGVLCLCGIGFDYSLAAPENWDLDFTTVWENDTTMKLSGVVVDLKGETASTLSVSFPRDASLKVEQAPTTWKNRTLTSGALSYITPVNNTSGEIKLFLESLRFFGERNVITGNIIVDIYDRQVSFRTDGNGDYHFYEFVGTHPLTWPEAYNFARNRNFRGLTGYLATVTSQQEFDFIYSITTSGGWLGGTRAIKKDGQKIISDEYIAFTGMIINDLQGANEWYWANGPEAGQKFYSTAKRNSIEGGSSIGKDVPYYYNWDGQSPDNCAGIEAYLASSRNPGAIKWNDAACAAPGTGYKTYFFVEYSGKEFIRTGAVPHSSEVPYLDLVILSPNSGAIVTTPSVEVIWEGELEGLTLSGYSYILTKNGAVVATGMLSDTGVTLANLSDGEYQFDLTLITTEGETVKDKSDFTVVLPVYTWSFDLNGGIGSIEQLTGKYGTTFDSLIVSTPTKTGFTFSGWNPSLPEKITADQTFKAEWTPIVYTITFDLDGGTGTANLTGIYNDSLTVTTPTKTGFTFIGWSPSLPERITADQTFKAQWKANPTSSSSSGGGYSGGGGISHSTTTSSRLPEGTPVKTEEINSEVFNPTIKTSCFNPLDKKTIDQGNKMSELLRIAHQMLYSYELTRWQGTKDFAPERSLTREEAARFMTEFATNVLCRKQSRTYNNHFIDLENADPTLLPYIKKSYEYLIFNGDHNADGSKEKTTFRPKELITVGELAAIMTRLVRNELMEEEEGDWSRNYKLYISSITPKSHLVDEIRGTVAEVIYDLYRNNNYELREIGYVIKR